MLCIVHSFFPPGVCVGILIVSFPVHTILTLRHIDMSRFMREQTFSKAKIKAQTSIAVTAKLISAFVFGATRICSLKTSSEAAQPALCQTWSDTRLIICFANPAVVVPSVRK